MSRSSANMENFGSRGATEDGVKSIDHGALRYSENAI